MKLIFFSLLVSFKLSFVAHSAELFTYPITMKISNGGTNYVSATLADSVTANFLVDTGSGMLVVNQDTFKALKQKQNKDIQFSHEAAARLANGKLHRVDVYTVNQFRIGAHCEIGKVDVAVIKKGNNILGMSALKKAAPFAVSIDPPTLLLSHCSDTLAGNIATLVQR
jgi:predicted aspartyl protease